jgi:hypothetical protein
MITVPSNELVGQIHDRMPAILKPESYERWLGLEPPRSSCRGRRETWERTGEPFDVWAPLEQQGAGKL